MAPVKMIAIDLDDTLLRDDISISNYTKDVLRKVMEKNIPIVIATGRMFQAARPWGRAIGLGDVPLICYTGAFVGLCESGRVVRDVTMDMETAQGIVDTAHERGWYMHAYIDDEVYVPFRDDRTEAYERQCGVTAHVLGDDFWKLAKAPTKLLVFERDPKVMAEVEQVLSEKFSRTANRVKSKPEFFEMNRKGMSKGAALAELCGRRGIPMSSLMTFGNGHNDISMFKLTDWSFAVENAAESAKAAAHFITASNNEDGVAKAIEKYVLEV